jgi:hypothetical protein
MRLDRLDVVGRDAAAAHEREAHLAARDGSGGMRTKTVCGHRVRALREDGARAGRLPLEADPGF